MPDDEIGKEKIRLYHPGLEPIGKEPNQDPVKLAPIPSYAYPSVPVQRPTPGTPPPVQLVRDPERVTVPEPSRRRENAPVAYSPTPARTRPFMPASRD